MIENSVIGLRCFIGRDAVIRNSIVMGNDFYEMPDGIAHGDSPTAEPPLGIGPRTHIEGAIIDKNCRIGRNVRIVNRQGVESTEENEFGMIRDGIVVVTKSAILPDGFVF